MERKHAIQLLTVVMLCALMPFLVAPTGVEPVSTGVSRQGDGWTAAGPYIDRVIFQVITGPDVQVAALIAGDIDCLADNVEASYIDELSANPNIEVTQTERLGFGFMAINCQRYPWTFPEFRRALAFAADKYEVATIMWEGLGFALDIPVPASCGVWHNDATTPDYKDPQVAAAVAELASAGFVDLTVTDTLRHQTVTKSTSALCTPLRLLSGALR